MKKIALMLAMFSCMSAADEENLMQYVEVRIAKNDLIAFSDQAVQARFCGSCPVQTLTVAAKTEYWEHNAPITFKQATELFVKRAHESVSVFYDRKAMQLDLFVFGGFLEDQPMPSTPTVAE